MIMSIGDEDDEDLPEKRKEEDRVPMISPVGDVGFRTRRPESVKRKGFMIVIDD